MDDRLVCYGLTEKDKKKIFNFCLDNAASAALNGIGVGVLLALIFRRPSLLYLSTGYAIGNSLSVSNKYLLEHIDKNNL